MIVILALLSMFPETDLIQFNIKIEIRNIGPRKYIKEITISPDGADADLHKLEIKISTDSATIEMRTTISRTAIHLASQYLLSEKVNDIKLDCRYLFDGGSSRSLKGNICFFGTNYWFDMYTHGSSMKHYAENNTDHEIEYCENRKNVNKLIYLLIKNLLFDFDSQVIKDFIILE